VSKADDAQQAARDVEEQVRDVGFPAADLVEVIGAEYGVAPSVVEAWLLRKHSSLTALDEWGMHHRSAILVRETQHKERLQSEARKFADLAQIIEAIPDKALLLASLNVVGNIWSASWRQWIKDNCPDPEVEIAAIIFARTRFRLRIADTAASKI
jgi:hypothetical protein